MTRGSAPTADLRSGKTNGSCPRGKVHRRRQALSSLRVPAL